MFEYLVSVGALKGQETIRTLQASIFYLLYCLSLCVSTLCFRHIYYTNKVMFDVMSGNSEETQHVLLKMHFRVCLKCLIVDAINNNTYVCCDKTYLELKKST